MSGGSYDYAYRRVEEFRYAMLQAAESSGVSFEHRVYPGPENAEPSCLSEEEWNARKWFAQHLEFVIEGMKAVEWVDSGDFSPGDEVKAIEALVRHKRSRK